MSERIYEIEDGLLLCEQCGREYTSNLSECPYCEAERQAKLIAKHGSYKPRWATALGVILAVVLVAGAALLVRSAALSGGWSIGREYATEDEDAQVKTVGAGTTQQQTDLDSVVTEPKPTESDDTTSADEESAESDDVTSEDEESAESDDVTSEDEESAKSDDTTTEDEEDAESDDTTTEDEESAEPDGEDTEDE
ncbi:MAG: hypothetical protein LUD79_01005 [Oscillospiraceae bacterium]|nr:hypothetical protein [Oscillospiraceae bacterium]